MSQPSRRTFIEAALFGMGGLGLRALATGLPPAVIARPGRAWAAAEAGARRPQFLLMATSSGGDPANVYAPGSYAGGDISRSADPAMAAAAVTLGAKTVQAGGGWPSLPASFFSRACFFHHATTTIGHGDGLKVLDLMGAVRRGENIVALTSKALQPALGTISSDPVPTDVEPLTAAGRPLARLSPLGLKTSLITPATPLSNLTALRDQTLDKVYAVYKGEATAAQRAFIDEMATSQAQARQISDSVLSGLSSLSADDVDNEILAAILLFKLKVTPAVVVHLNFGNDNHSDLDLKLESTWHPRAVASIGKMIASLGDWGLADDVTFAMLNVFGRSLANSAQGRGHNGGHNVGIICGANVKPQVVGGAVRPQGGSDYVASDIDSATGAAAAGADIAQADSLAAFGQTLGAALGVAETYVSDQVTAGKVVRSCLT